MKIFTLLMDIQMCFKSESFIATIDITFEWFFSRMFALMINEILFIRKSFIAITVITSISDIQMNGLLMCFQ